MFAAPELSDPVAAAELGRLLEGYGRLVRAEIDAILLGTPGLERFYGMMAYHLGRVDSMLQPQKGRPGKSLRPALCLLVAEALGGNTDECAPFAAGIELLHNFSLIHDDIEDRSPTRRGRPTVWTLWGEAQAINVGDGMFSMAHQAWLHAPLAERDPVCFLALARALEDTISALCEGQYLDIAAEGSLTISSDAYITMIGRKTAALMGTAAWVGGRCATTDLEVLTAARAFGTELGLAFQIRDDLLGIWGDESETGKSAASDIAARKMTLPVVLALEHGTAAQRAELTERYAEIPNKPDDESAIRAVLTAAGADRRAAEREEEHWQAALNAVSALHLGSDWTARLRAFAVSLVGRAA